MYVQVLPGRLKEEKRDSPFIIYFPPLFPPKVIVVLLEESSPTRVVASLSQNGVAMSINEIVVKSKESREILLKVPPDNSKGSAQYKLRWVVLPCNIVQCLMDNKAIKQNQGECVSSRPIGPASNNEGERIFLFFGWYHLAVTSLIGLLLETLNMIEM